jgi:hypothetical protein
MPVMDSRVGMAGGLSLPPPPAVDTQRQATGLTGLLGRVRGGAQADQAGAITSPVMAIVDLIERTLQRASDSEPTFKPYADAAISLLRRGAEAIGTPTARSPIPTALEAGRSEIPRGPIEGPAMGAGPPIGAPPGGAGLV